MRLIYAEFPIHASQPTSEVHCPTAFLLLAQRNHALCVMWLCLPQLARRMHATSLHLYTCYKDLDPALMCSCPLVC